MAADGPAPDALALLAGFKQWLWQAPFGAFRFSPATGSEPQILGAEQKTKNFQLFSRVASEGKHFSVRLVLAEFTLAEFTVVAFILRFVFNTSLKVFDLIKDTD